MKEYGVYVFPYNHYGSLKYKPLLKAFLNEKFQATMPIARFLARILYDAFFNSPLMLLVDVKERDALVERALGIMKTVVADNKSKSPQLHRILSLFEGGVKELKINKASNAMVEAAGARTVELRRAVEEDTWAAPVVPRKAVARIVGEALEAARIVEEVVEAVRTVEGVEVARIVEMVEVAHIAEEVVEVARTVEMVGVANIAEEELEVARIVEVGEPVGCSAAAAAEVGQDMPVAVAGTVGPFEVEQRRVEEGREEARIHR
ncbi:hypothetical protein HDU98_010178 [Podochytrium sp. JEL0797]|nr:hypothetical protein HDU98_010178 [Podochytrium sp. JEL0797]